MIWLWLALAWGWDEVGEGGRKTGHSWEASARFSDATLPAMAVHTDPLALGRVAERTAAALRACAAPEVCQAGAFLELGVDLDKVIATLDFVALVAREDAGKPRQRLLDPVWLAQTFRVLRWAPDTHNAASRDVKVTPEAIRLTKYLVYQVRGSAVRTNVYNTALYGVLADDDGGWARFTRVEAYAGAFEPGGAGEGMLRPLVYLTREGVNQALMQGTVEVRMSDGSRTLFNVHENNGVAYDPAQKDGNLQERYWTFQERSGVIGVQGVVLEPGASVAGDVYNIGFGKLVALHSDTGMHLAVLADTGGAFQPNLFQLDWLAGAFPSHEDYEKGVAHLPRRAVASVLVLR